eukprot:symbB.v1.2.016458.t1/scaffold1252.1/size200744/6
MGFTSFAKTGANLDTLQSTLTSTDVSKEEDDYAAKESPPGQASYSLQSYKELFPGYPLWGSQTQLTNCANVISFNLRPAHQPGQPGFAEDAPPELMRAMKMNDGETSVLCGASLGDNRISCGVHLFDDPKSGAPYVVPLPDTGRALKAVMPQASPSPHFCGHGVSLNFVQEVGGAEDMAEDGAGGFGAGMQQSSTGMFMLWSPGDGTPFPLRRERQRRCSFLEVTQMYIEPSHRDDPKR